MGNPRTLQIIFLAVVIGCLAGVFLSRAERAAYTIRIAFLSSPDDEDYAGSRAFKETVERLTAGRVSVQIFASGQFCGNERECIEAMQSSVLEVHQTTIGGLAALLPPAQVFDLPYGLADDAQAACVFNGPLVRALEKEILDRGLGLRLMAVAATGSWRAFATVSKPVIAPEDLRGLKIRTTPSALEQAIARALGANPTPLPFSEVYTALSTGVVDGTKNSIQDIVGAKLHENLRHLLLDRHGYMASLWWFSESQWRKLPPDVQDAVRIGFDDLARALEAASMKAEAPALEAFKAQGGEVTTPTPEQRAALREATREVRDWYIDRFGRQWLDQFDAAVAACPPAPVAPPGG